MRKLFLLLSVLLFVSAVLVAQEMDINYSYTTKESLCIQDADDASADILRRGVPVGMDINIDIPFNEAAFQYGMNIDAGLDFLGDYEMGEWGMQEDFFYGSYFVSLGALFRLNMGRHNSLAFRPGVQFTMGLGGGTMYVQGVEKDISIDTTAMYGSLSLNVGWTLWCSDSFGFTAGIDYDKPFVGMYTITNRQNSADKYMFDITGDSRFRVFVGLAFYLGNRYSAPVQTASTPPLPPAQKPAPQTPAATTAPQAESADAAPAASANAADAGSSAVSTDMQQSPSAETPAASAASEPAPAKRARETESASAEPATAASAEAAPAADATASAQENYAPSVFNGIRRRLEAMNAASAASRN